MISGTLENYTIKYNSLIIYYSTNYKECVIIFIIFAMAYHR